MVGRPELHNVRYVKHPLQTDELLKKDWQSLEDNTAAADQSLNRRMSVSESGA